MPAPRLRGEAKGEGPFQAPRRLRTSRVLPRRLFPASNIEIMT